MPNAELFLSLNNISIRLHERLLFENLSWEILGDQHWAVIGPNGSGKSTLMRAICGDLPIVSGNIAYPFASGNGKHPPQDRIAYVNFEAQRRVLASEAFYQERWNIGIEEDTLAVSEYLSEQSVHRFNAFHIAEHSTDPGFAARQREIAERLELDPLWHKQVVQLSNGERRKALIARALLKNPRLLILDNPFNGLDERFRKKLADNLDNLMRGEVRVMLFATSQDELPRGITNVLFVCDNRVTPEVREAPPSDLRVSNALPNRTTAARANVQPNPGREILVQMQDVNVSYNGTPVLHHINWVVRQREQWALLGPNGAGKTTLLSLILADNPQAYANDITLFGKRRGSGESIWEIKQNIGWVAPELQLYYPRNATCLEVACSGWFDSVGLYRECTVEQRTIAEKWLGQFGMAERAGVALERVSEGEQRLALIARAMVKEPLLLVLDEPCQGLDEKNRDRVLQAIDGLSQRAGASMIYVTHRADELPPSITHVLRLEAGRVVV